MLNDCLLMQKEIYKNVVLYSWPTKYIWLLSLPLSSYILVIFDLTSDLLHIPVKKYFPGECCSRSCGGQPDCVRAPEIDSGWCSQSMQEIYSWWGSSGQHGHTNSSCHHQITVYSGAAAGRLIAPHSYWMGPCTHTMPGRLQQSEILLPDTW